MTDELDFSTPARRIALALLTEVANLCPDETIRAVTIRVSKKGVRYLEVYANGESETGKSVKRLSQWDNGPF